MRVFIKDIKKGDVFKYILDWDLFGNAVMSGEILAKKDAVVSDEVMVQIDDVGLFLVLPINQKVEKINAVAQ